MHGGRGLGRQSVSFGCAYIEQAEKNEKTEAEILGSTFLSGQMAEHS